MCYTRVNKLVKENVQNKLYNFLLKNSRVVYSVKDFNETCYKESIKTVCGKVMNDEEDATNLKTIYVKSRINAIKVAKPKKAYEKGLNQVIHKRFLDRRDALKEIIHDYPVTKKALNFHPEGPNQSQTNL